MSTKGFQKRLISDITDIMKHPLTNQGIYYVHDEVNMLMGYAMILGPKDTIYSDGIYFFTFEFPTNYPYSPPKLLFKTYDSKTRFHPNLYRNGKVCLSILNTWRGEQWTACQTIRSVLLTLVTLFHNKSLLNEPGITSTHKDFEKYHTIIEYKNFEVCILQMITQEKIPTIFLPFNIYIKKHFIKEKDDIMKRLKKHAEPLEIYKLSTGIYSMTSDINYNYLYKKFQNIVKKYIN